MAGLIVTNNATSLLQSAITAGQTTLTVAAADAALFPAPAAGDWFPVTLVEGTKLEICRCTARAGAVLTVTRAQESTIAQAFGINAQVDHRLTMAAIQTFLQDAPSDGSTYGRKNAAWATTIAEAPNDANAYVRSALAWVVGYTKAAIDTLLAAKIGDAPNDANAYVRSGLAWVLGYTKSATDTLLAAKAPTANPTFTGTVTGAAATFSTTLSVTGLMTATGGVSLPTVGTGVQFPTPGMSIVGRATSVGWNSAANGSGTDVMALTPAGILSFGSAGGVSLPVERRADDGRCRRRHPERVPAGVQHHLRAARHAEGAGGRVPGSRRQGWVQRLDWRVKCLGRPVRWRGCLRQTCADAGGDRCQHRHHRQPRRQQRWHDDAGLRRHRRHHDMQWRVERRQWNSGDTGRSAGSDWRRGGWVHPQHPRRHRRRVVCWLSLRARRSSRQGWRLGLGPRRPRYFHQWFIGWCRRDRLRWWRHWRR
jgi:hypothetical protein